MKLSVSVENGSWNLLLTAVDDDVVVTYQFCKSFASEFEAFRTKRDFENLEMIDISEWSEI